MNLNYENQLSNETQNIMTDKFKTLSESEQETVIQKEMQILVDAAADALKSDHDWIEIGGVKFKMQDGDAINHMHCGGRHMIHVGKFNDPFLMLQYPSGFSL